MSGTICNGVGTDQPTLRQSKAYCEGRNSAATGGTQFGTLTTGTVESDNALTWTEKVPSGIFVALVDPGVAGASLSVAVDDYAITVNLATGAAGNITTGVEGNNNAITWTPTTANLRYAVALVDPSAIDQTLSIDVSGNLITVNLATDGAGDITSTPADIIPAIIADEDAAALVTPTDTGASTGAAAVVAEADAIGDLASTAAQVDAAVDAASAAAALVTPANTEGSDGSGVVLAEAAQTTTGSSTPFGFREPIANADWSRGFTSWAADPSGVARDCCADAYGGGYS